jgi:hypothetical protein
VTPVDALVALLRELEGAGTTVMALVRGGRPSEPWTLYPDEFGIFDGQTRCQFYYHSHGAAHEDGHFHTVRLFDGHTVHLVGISMAESGWPQALFTLYPFPTLAERGLVHDRFEDTPLLVYYSRADGTAVAWQRRAGDRELTFEEMSRPGDGGTVLLRDRQTGSLWSWLRGQAVLGPLAGTQLQAVAYNPILVDRFHAFYPDGPTYAR